MPGPDAETAALTADESWGAIHTTMDRARSSMYVAGTATILLLWGAIVALGYFGQYAIETLASEFATGKSLVSRAAMGRAGGGRNGGQRPHRAPRGRGVRGLATPLAALGIRVFLFWLAVVSAAFLVPAAAGLWTAERCRHRHSARRGGHRGAGTRAVWHHAPPGDSGGGRGICGGVLPAQLSRGRSRRCWLRRRRRWSWWRWARPGYARAASFDRRGRGPQRDHPSVDAPANHDAVGHAARDGPARLRLHPKDPRLDRRQLDHPPAQARGRGLPRPHEGVRRSQAAHVGSGDAGGPPGLCRIPRRVWRER